MIGLPPGVPIYLCTEPVDFRKGFDGLTGIVTTAMNHSVTDGSMFLFVNRRRDRIKALWWETGGLTLWYRRLEQGTVELPKLDGDKPVPKVRVPRSALTNGIRRLNEAMRWQPTQQSGAARLVRGSAVVTGWANYYRIAHDFKRAANTLDFHAYWIGVKALCRRYDVSTAQCIRKYGQGDNLNVGGSYTLKRAQDIEVSWKQESPEPYNPGTGCYLEDVDWEAEIRQYENRQRPGRMDFKAWVLFRDGYRCRQCGNRVTIETSESDHIKPVNCFANFAQANHLFNLQTLCLQCHKQKHGAKSSRHSGKPDAGKSCTSGLGLGPG